MISKQMGSVRRIAVLWALIGFAIGVFLIASYAHWSWSVKPYWDLVHTVNDEVGAIREMAPSDVDAEQWEAAMDWTGNVVGNVTMLTNECDLEFLSQFQSGLQRSCPIGETGAA